MIFGISKMNILRQIQNWKNCEDFLADFTAHSAGWTADMQSYINPMIVIEDFLL